MSMTQISLDEATLASLDAVASARALTREETVREAIKTLVEYDVWFRRKVEAGLKDIQEGRVISSQEMEAEADSLCLRLAAHDGLA